MLDSFALSIGTRFAMSKLLGRRKRRGPAGLALGIVKLAVFKLRMMWLVATMPFRLVRKMAGL